MTVMTSCTDCEWSVEADDSTDAALASMHHYDAAHAEPWCWFCCIPGPAAARADHPECVELTILDYDQDEPDQ